MNAAAAPAKLYRGNRRGMAGLGFVAFIAFSVALGSDAREAATTRAWSIGSGAAVMALCLTLIAWMISIRLALTRDGLSYRSMFGAREIRWADVVRVNHEVVRYSIHGLPIWTHRAVRLVEESGKRFALGNRIAQPDRMMADVIELTSPFLYARMAAELNRGVELDLGAVRLSRVNGLQMKGLFGFGAITLDEIDAYEVRDGEFCVRKRGARSAKCVRAAGVANVYALLAVLDSLFKGPPAHAAGFRAPHTSAASPPKARA